MNRNPGMNRFFVEAVHMYGPTPGRRQWSYRVRDKDKCVPHFGAATVATTKDPDIADKIADYLNGDDSSRLVEARKALELKAAEADMLRTQLFETREQRDEARESSAANGAEAERAREALEASHRELANARNYWANQGPHDHVVISLAGYSKLVTERDEALAKYAACVDVVSLVNGRWVRTS